MDGPSTRQDLEIKKDPLPLGEVNVGFEPGESKDIRSRAGGKWPSTESDPPAYNEAIREEGDGMDVDLTGPESEEERIMLMLRDIVRKCTNVNPLKRPTAKEVLEMLEEVAPAEYFEDDFDIPDADDDDEYDDYGLEKRIAGKELKED